jgi:hypothetical protein
LEKAGCATDGKADLTADHDLSAQPLKRALARTPSKPPRSYGSAWRSTARPAHCAVIDDRDARPFSPSSPAALSHVPLGAGGRAGAGTLIRPGTRACATPAAKFRRFETR